MLIVVLVDDEESDLGDFRWDGGGGEVAAFLDDGGDFDFVGDFWIADFTMIG